MKNYIELINVNDLSTFQEIEELLERHQIVYIGRDADLLKDHNVSEIYNGAKIFVHKEDFEVASKLLKANGYQNGDYVLLFNVNPSVQSFFSKIPFFNRLRFAYQLLTLVGIGLTIFTLIIFIFLAPSFEETLTADFSGWKITSIEYEGRELITVLENSKDGVHIYFPQPKQMYVSFQFKGNYSLKNHQITFSDFDFSEVDHSELYIVKLNSAFNQTFDYQLRNYEYITLTSDSSIIKMEKYQRRVGMILR